ncbi:MAG: hypothetical protein AMXMBFR53_01630 [Gemmatimonadota bacterium]
MILHCNYEEITALTAGGRSFLEREPDARGRVLAPEEGRARVEALLPRLVGDLSLGSLAEVWGVALAVDAIVEHLRAEMEAVVVTTHAADESAVAAYFDFAHALSVSHRIHEMVAEMEALIELVTGDAPDTETARSFRFPE